MKKETKTYIEIQRRYNKIAKIIVSCETTEQLSTMEKFIFGFERKTLKVFLPFRSIYVITLMNHLEKLYVLKGKAIIAQKCRVFSHI